MGARIAFLPSLDFGVLMVRDAGNLLILQSFGGEKNNDRPFPGTGRTCPARLDLFELAVVFFVEVVDWHCDSHGRNGARPS